MNAIHGRVDGWLGRLAGGKAALAARIFAAVPGSAVVHPDDIA